MKNRYVGLLIIGTALIFFLVVMSFNNALETIVNTTCSHGPTCPMYATLKIQKVISYSLIGLLIAVGALVAFFFKDEKITETRIIEHHESSKSPQLSAEEQQKKLERLEAEEKIIMDIVLRENGSTYQSDLIKETGKSKVVITRLLDKLEGKGLIERKRRGMTNMVILK